MLSTRSSCKDCLIISSRSRFSRDRGSGKTAGTLRLGRFQPIVKARHTQDYRLHDDQSVVVDDAPENKCQFEYSTIDLAGRRWWTISFEAIGEHRHRLLRAAAETIISQHNLALTAERLFGYPQFILAAQDC